MQRALACMQHRRDPRFCLRSGATRTRCRCRSHLVSDPLPTRRHFCRAPPGLPAWCLNPPAADPLRLPLVAMTAPGDQYNGTVVMNCHIQPTPDVSNEYIEYRTGRRHCRQQPGAPFGCVQAGCTARSCWPARSSSAWRRCCAPPSVLLSEKQSPSLRHHSQSVSRRMRILVPLRRR